MIPAFDFASYEHCKKLKELGLIKPLRPMAGVYTPLSSCCPPALLGIVTKSAYEDIYSQRTISGIHQGGNFVVFLDLATPAFSFGELSRIATWIFDSTDYESSEVPGGKESTAPMPEEEVVDIYHPNFLANVLLDALYQKAVTVDQINALLDDPTLLGTAL
jgi:hypothetical protein